MPRGLDPSAPRVGTVPVVIDDQNTHAGKAGAAGNERRLNPRHLIRRRHAQHKFTAPIGSVTVNKQPGMLITDAQIPCRLGQGSGFVNGLKQIDLCRSDM